MIDRQILIADRDLVLWTSLERFILLIPTVKHETVMTAQQWRPGDTSTLQRRKDREIQLVRVSLYQR